LYTAINNPNIATFVGIDMLTDAPAGSLKKDEMSELSKWMFEKNSEGFTRLGESRNLRLLNKVVANDKALDAFRKHKSLRDAVLLTDEPQEIFQISVTESLNKLQIARDYIHLIDEPSSKDEENLLEISKLSRTLSTTLKAKSLESEEERDTKNS
jgi:hypothetical protein